jgi:triosephosphate isomerase
MGGCDKRSKKIKGKMKSTNRTPVIAANWKMHKTIEEAVCFVKGLIPLILNVPVKVYVAPPYTALHSSAVAARNSPVVIGGQNMNDENEGAFTGEISANMLKDAGAEFVILGHSERRHLFNETNDFIRRKVKKALSKKLQPLLCIGETKQEREEEKTEQILKQQLEESLGDISPEEMETIILAYEPVWAIGTGSPALPKEVQVIHHFCRQLVRQKWGADTAEKVIIQYGGSVHPQDVKELMELPDVDGVLVGGASLTLDLFNQIIHYSR